MQIRKRKKISVQKMVLIGSAIAAGFILSIFIGLKMASAPSWNPFGPSKPTNGNPLHGVEFYADPESNAAKQANTWKDSDPEKAKLMERLADLPTARWVTDQTIFDEHAAYVAAAAKEKKVPVLVSYFFPKRDCGRYSTGGAKDDNIDTQYLLGFGGKPL